MHLQKFCPTFGVHIKKEMTTYRKEFKEEAIRLSDEIGNKKAAAQLGIPYYTLADWRNHSKHKETTPMSEEELRIRNIGIEKQFPQISFQCVQFRVYLVTVIF